MVENRRRAEDDVPTIPPVAAMRRDETFGEQGLASRARHAARRVVATVATVAAAVGSAVRLLASAARGESPSSPRAGLRPVPALVVPVPVRARVVPLHTARRRARMTGHPAGHCCQW